MADEFVTVSDLNRTYTTTTHPKLADVTKFVNDVNEILLSWHNNNSSVTISAAFKQVGKMLVEARIHNRKVDDNIEGYKFRKPEFITQDLADILMQGAPFTTKFSWNPGSNNSSFI